MAKATPTKRTSAGRSAPKSSAPKKPAAGKVAAGSKKVAAGKGATKPPTATKSSTRSASSNGAETATPKRRGAAPFSKTWLQKQEAGLHEERATYLRQADILKAEADALVADFESGDAQFDEDGGEGDTLSSERERDLALAAQARTVIEEIDHALAKFANGTYGICEVSGDPIPQERLEAIPWARVQVQHKTGGLGRP